MIIDPLEELIYQNHTERYAKNFNLFNTKPQAIKYYINIRTPDLMQ